MKEKLIGQAGTSIKIVTGQIQKQLKNGNLQAKRERDVKKPRNLGTLSAKDWRNISLGIDALLKIVNEAYRVQGNSVLSGDKDSGKMSKNLIGYQKVINDFIGRLHTCARDEAYIQGRIEEMKDFTQIAQAARDGVIIKKETRLENVNGEEREVYYDTSMTPDEAVNILRAYNIRAENIQSQRLNNYLGLGLGTIGMLGTLMPRNQSANTVENKKGTGFVSLSTTAITGLKLIQGIMDEGDGTRKWQLRDQQDRMKRDLFGNEQVSARAEDDTIASISSLAIEEKRLTH